MQSYDLYMLLIVVATTLWGVWKGVAWQLASVASLFSSYGLAYSLRVPVAKMIDAEPPWNMFAAMLVIYVLMSVASWVGFGLISEMIGGFKLKDFDRQLGGLLGAAKGAIVCVIVTFFAMTLMGPAQQETICKSRTGRYITIALRNSGGLIPPEIHAVVDPYLTTFQKKLENPGDPAVAAEEQKLAYDLAAKVVQNYAQQYLPPGTALPTHDQQYDPRYDPRYYQPQAPASYYPEQHYAADPRYADPRYSDPRYAAPSYPDPRYADPRYAAQTYTDPRYANPGYNDPRYADPRSYDPRYTDQRAAYPSDYDPRYSDPRYDPRYQPTYAQPAPAPTYYNQPSNREVAPDPRSQWR